MAYFIDRHLYLYNGKLTSQGRRKVFHIGAADLIPDPVSGSDLKFI